MKNRNMYAPVLAIVATFSIQMLFSPKIYSLLNCQCLSPINNVIVNGTIPIIDKSKILDVINVNFSNFQEKNSSYIYFRKGKFYTNYHIDIANINIVKYANVTISGTGGIVVDSKLFMPNLERCFKNKATTNTIIAHYSRVINIATFARAFGDIIHGSLCPLFLLPTDVIKNSVVFLPDEISGFKLFRQIYYKAGFPIENLVYIPKNSYIFADVAYSIESEKYHFHKVDGYPFWNLGKRMKEIYNVSKIDPINYGLLNRKQWTQRSIWNFDEICIAAKTAFPELHWIIMPHTPANLLDAANIWSSMKFIFTPTGSGMFNFIFMQPNTAILIAMTPTFDNAAICGALSLHINVVVMVEENWLHYGFTMKCLDPDLVIRMMNLTFKGLKNGKMLPEYF